jgi:hypothetical protein
MTNDIDILLEIHDNCNSNPHLDKDLLQSYCWKQVSELPVRICSQLGCQE